MPVCCIKNCKSRIDRSNKENYNLLLFYFPKENELRRQWLKACQRKEGDIKLSCGKFIYLFTVNVCIFDVTKIIKKSYF